MAYNSLFSSLLTTVITSSSTITSYVTVPTGLPPAIVSAIEGLAPCSQDITFTSLADSTCNPADFNCICLQFQNLGVVPVYNATSSAPAPVATPAAGGNTTSSYVAIITTDAAGNPTTLSSAVVVPVGPTTPVEDTGSAASMKMGALIGALGL